MESEPTLAERTIENLENARENGYFELDLDPWDVAQDMLNATDMLDIYAPWKNEIYGEDSDEHSDRVAFVHMQVADVVRAWQFVRHALDVSVVE